MSLKFLVALLNWLQGEFTVVAERHRERAIAIDKKIAGLKQERADEIRSNNLAIKLASNIETLLSE